MQFNALILLHLGFNIESQNVKSVNLHFNSAFYSIDTQEVLKNIFFF